VEGSPHLKQATAPGYSKYLLQINLNPILVPAHHSMFSGAYCTVCVYVLYYVIQYNYKLLLFMFGSHTESTRHVSTYMYNPVLYQKIK
jgi:hypothetical protein